VKTLKFLSDVCNRARCAECFYLYLVAISGHVIALPVYVCLNVGISVADLGGSENFYEGSNSWKFWKLSRRFRTLLVDNSLSVLTCHMHHVLPDTILLHPLDGLSTIYPVTSLTMYAI
jgi:hypothetical protein